MAKLKGQLFARLALDYAGGYVPGVRIKLRSTE